MTKTALITLTLLLLTSLGVHPGLALKSQSIIQLKKAGLSDATIQLMMETKSVETAAFSVEDILNFCKAGLRETTIQMLIKAGSFLKDRAPIIYGKDIRSFRFTTAQDIIELKKAGLGDDAIEAIIAVAGDAEDANRQEALDLLEHLNLRIDWRGRK
ncbi:MAG: hypothetical protein JSW39_06595 [Desulfobacterales bacterium]|nr:MAG: hypothetical protein JSW39_06595 [Desulfobacterales bacterium]